MEVPRDEHERTLAFADIAMGQIKALSQAATPRNFEIWYNYATGYNPALNQLINQTLAQKRQAQRRRSRRHLPPISRPAGRAIASTRSIRACSTRSNRFWSRSTPPTATNYSASLADVTAKLDGLRRRSLRAVVERLVKGAKDMELNNKKLEARLSASKQEIEQLQENLQAVRTESLTDPRCCWSRTTGTRHISKFQQLPKQYCRECLPPYLHAQAMRRSCR